MKRVLYLLILAALMTVGLRAEKVEDHSAQINNAEVNQIPKTIKAELLRAMESHKGQIPMPTGGSFESIDTFNDALFSNMMKVTPMVYEEKSGTIFIVRPHRYVPNPDNEADSLTGRLDILYSQNDGLDWNTLTVIERPGQLPLYPSIAVVNPSGSNDINDMLIYAFYVKFVYDGEGYTFDSFEYFLANSIAGSEYTQPEAGPDLNNPGGIQGWSFTRVAAFNGESNQYMLNYGSLAPEQGGRSGVYGVGTWTASNLDFQSSIPPNWDVSQFKDPGSADGSYNAGMHIDFDSEGNAYAGVVNIMANDDDRRPSVSKSTDNGKSWTNFEAMPASIVRTFYESKGGIYFNEQGSPVSWMAGSIPYGSEGFVVTGVDQYSFVYRFNIIRQDTSTYYLVEAYKDENGWSIREIANYEYVASRFFPDASPENRSFLYGPPLLRNYGANDTFVDSLIANPRHLEIQLARTVDNQHLVVKYIDTENLFALDTPTDIYGGDLTLDTLFNTDIYMGYREIDGGSWNISNVTNAYMDNEAQNPVYYKQTWIPQVVKSFSKVPMMTSAPVKPTSPTTTYTTAIYNYPDFMLQMYADNALDQYVMFASVDLTNQIPLDDPRAVKSVEENQEFTFEINKIYPNPVKSDRAEIAFTTSAFGNVFIAVYDLQGNKVMDVVNGNLGSGIHGKYLDLENLANGTYFVTMTFNGQTVSETLNITR